MTSRSKAEDFPALPGTKKQIKPQVQMRSSSPRKPLSLFREESMPFRPKNVVNMQSVKAVKPVQSGAPAQVSPGRPQRRFADMPQQPRLSATAAGFVPSTQLKAGSLVRIASVDKVSGRWNFDDLYTKVESKMFPGFRKLNYKSVGYVSAVLRNGYMIQLFNSKEERYPFTSVRSLDTEAAKAIQRETTELCSILDSVVVDLEKGECNIQKYFKRTGGLMVKLAFLGEDISKYTQGTEIRVADLAVHPRDFSKTRVEKVRHLHKLAKGARADLEAFLEHSMRTGFTRSAPRHVVRDCYATHLRWKKENPRDPKSSSCMFISFNARLEPQSAAEYLQYGIRWKNRRYQVERPMTKTAKFVARNPLKVTVQDLITPPVVEERTSLNVPPQLKLRPEVSGSSVCSSITVEPPVEIESPPMSPRPSQLKLQSWASINSNADRAEASGSYTLEQVRLERLEAATQDEIGSLPDSEEFEKAPRKLTMRNWASYNESDTLCPNELPAMPNLNYPQLPPAKIVRDHTARKALNMSNDNSDSLKSPKKLSNDASLESVKEETKEDMRNFD